MKLTYKPNGKPNWNAVFVPEHIGKLIEIPANLRQSAYEAGSKHGFRVTTTATVNPEIILISPTGRSSEKSKLAVTPSDLRDAKLRDHDIVRKLKEATENLAYWRRQRALRSIPEAKAEAGARVLLWENEIRVLESKFQPTVL